MSKRRLKGLSLFANVGIAEAYFKEIGVDILIANELVDKRCKLYSDVYPETQMVAGDITNEDIRTYIVEQAKKYKVDFIIATPPCQGMSVAGNRSAFDERNQLIYYAVDVIQRVKPDFALIENVPTILKTKIIVDNSELLIPDYLKTVLSEYKFNSQSLVKAMDYGIPQMRERNIFLLVKNDINNPLAELN